jgi:hypothetical protein
MLERSPQKHTLTESIGGTDMLIESLLKAYKLAQDFSKVSKEKKKKTEQQANTCSYDLMLNVRNTCGLAFLTHTHKCTHTIRNDSLSPLKQEKKILNIKLRKKVGRKEGRQEGRKAGRKEGKKEEGRKKRRKKGKTKQRKRREGKNEGRKELKCFTFQ